MSKADMIDAAVRAYLDRLDVFEGFREEVVRHFAAHAELNGGPLPALHSIKSRLKDPDHLRAKIARKWTRSNPIDAENVFGRVTDLAGVRLLYLHPSQFRLIHVAVMEAVRRRGWVLCEEPVAYTSDPTASRLYRRLGLAVRVKESGYASVHYVVRPSRDSAISCEIQVRTLFEEAWLELDHATSYRHGGASASIREQLRALAKLAKAGARLAEGVVQLGEEPSEILRLPSTRRAAVSA